MAAAPSEPRILLDDAAIGRAVEELAAGIRARHPEGRFYFVGIESRGVFLARRLAAILAADFGERPIGTLDISLYRDDLDGLKHVPQLRGSHIPFDMDGATVILCDDVLYTGRTIRAALEEMMDFGRPAQVELCVLLDRGRRELPIQADYVAARHQTAANEYIRVRLREQDERDAVVLGQKEVSK